MNSYSWFIGERNIGYTFCLNNWLILVLYKVRFGLVKRVLHQISEIIIRVVCIFVFLAAACVGNPRQKRENRDGNNLEKIARPVLVNEIDAFLVGRQTDDSLKIISVIIRDSLLYIIPNVYYETGGSAGYSFYKGKLVGFYIDRFAGNWNLVDTTKLEKGAAKGYPSTFPESDPAFDSLEYKYDYRVRTYRIHNKDSVELIFWGYY